MKSAVASKVKSALNAVKNTFSVLATRVKSTNKNRKKRTKTELKAINTRRKNVILGIGLLLVVVSIGYSTYVVRTFVDTNESLVALVPQAVFALIIIVKAFAKLYK